MTGRSLQQAAAPAFPNGVAQILALRSDEQMIGPNTGRRVALVEH
jgi:hypothetical protein